MKNPRILIVGGVAGGASAAARARRLSEAAEIVVFERGPHVSFANCGLPYHVGGAIPEKARLLLHTPESLRARFNLDVRVRTEVVSIDRERREVEAVNRETGERYREGYDALVLATGSRPVRPAVDGVDRPGHFTVRTVPDVEGINRWIAERQAQRAVVIGGGYIGLEMAEQLRHRGLHVSLVEAAPQVLAPFDPEMAAHLHLALQRAGVALYCGASLSAFDEARHAEQAAASVVVLDTGRRLPADLVVLALGARPDVALAQRAGLEIGTRGGIRVDEGMRTSDPHVFAVGDAVEVRDRVTGRWTLLPLAGPANRQGRIAADNLFGGRSTYEGTWGTAIVRVFDQVAACTGANEKTLRQEEIPYRVVHLHPGSHAGYFPGAAPIALKLLFSPEDERILGVQAVGADGVDKRVDVIAAVMQNGGTVRDLAELELAYAPPFGSAKDPVNLAGMMASNVLDGLVETAQWHEVAHAAEDVVFVDVRSEEERARGAIAPSLHIPLPELRERLGEVPADREVVVYCHSGQRSYYAARLLAQHGFRVRNLSGAWRTWSTAHDDTAAAGAEGPLERARPVVGA